MFLLLLALVSVGATEDEFERFERKAAAARLLCEYQGDYVRSRRDRHIVWWTYDGEGLVMNGLLLKADLFRAKANSVIVDIGKLVDKAALFSPNGELPFFLKQKYYVNFEKGFSVLAIGDRFNIKGRCEAF